ncbi:hypothetical protein EV207_11978 [Scopulibacillus darangshiensis]|uniref:Rhodanese domain-containing protein n=1 Tax=Scopulibacillus darangshiensis TaxID=442528 RepID=A0A4R2NZ02_9BACL|nr:rhodanese-like domain-containing protein [Scopulibacillus darangshiensis]TCP26645.1 hypothetical protein EV207_11978 [Scopulibacillus darangshiensis]
MTTTISILIIVIAIAGLVFRGQRVKRLGLKKLPIECLDKSKHCLIDIRDFITSHNEPVKGAENIPLSYLKRSTKDKAICNRMVVLITDNQRAARSAARIMKKHSHTTGGCYYTMI